MTFQYDPELSGQAAENKAWPFEEARRLLERLKKRGKITEPVIFETGYGPSGLPHIGTFGEVVRTSMVRHAFRTLTEDQLSTRLICFSDDMDGLRKIPGNIPNQEAIADYLEKPLTAIPDPFGTHQSFGAHNNARLISFLDQFGFEYEFFSATECYKSGIFDATLMQMLEYYDQIIDIILPTLGEQRQKTYAPFLPICPETGHVLQVPILERNPAQGTLIYEDPKSGVKREVPVTGGQVKCQWKADWAMRWKALGVDYEMAGKDLIDSVRLSSRICRTLKGVPPEGFSYELFLDEKGEKISKSKGNGLTLEEWLTYATPESLSLYMFQKPKTAKRLHFDVIPKAVDEYLTFLVKYPGQEIKERLSNPVWHLHSGAPPDARLPLSFALLLNLVSASNADDSDVLWGFIRRYAPEASPESHPLLDQLVAHAIHYFNDFVAPHKRFRDPNEVEREALQNLCERLGTLPPEASAEEIQTLVYEIGKAHHFDPLRNWFRALYEVLLGQSQGPRFGSFIALYGIEESRLLIADALERDAVV